MRTNCVTRLYATVRTPADTADTNAVHRAAPMTTKRTLTKRRLMASYRKEGQYYYAPHRNMWGIWQWHLFNIADGGYGKFVKDCPSQEDARREVYRLNGW